MTKEELQKNTHLFLTDAQEATEAVMATLTSLMMKYKIPTSIGVPMITDVHRMAYESSLETARMLGYKDSASDALNEIVEQQTNQN